MDQVKAIIHKDVQRMKRMHQRVVIRCKEDWERLKGYLKEDDHEKPSAELLVEEPKKEEQA